MSKKQQERKKKQREEKAKMRVLARRNTIRKKNSEDKKAAVLDRKFRNKIQPIIKDPLKKEVMEKIKNEKILSKLEKNAEILKVLEKQYLDEVEQKNKINQQLEAEGHITLEEKMAALEKKIRDNMTEEQKETGRIDKSE
jgi:hypothetical protein